MDIAPDKERLRRLRGITEAHIGKEILFCPKCEWQFAPGEYGRVVCPDCGDCMHISRIDQELLNLIYYGNIRRRGVLPPYFSGSDGQIPIRDFAEQLIRWVMIPLQDYRGIRIGTVARFLHEPEIVESHLAADYILYTPSVHTATKVVFIHTLDTLLIGPVCRAHRDIEMKLMITEVVYCSILGRLPLQS